MISTLHSTLDLGSLPIPGSQFAYYRLAISTLRLLPEQHSLVVDHADGAMTLIDWQTQISFTDQELDLLIMLMERWPSYVPYEKLLAQIVDDVHLCAQTIENARNVGDQVALDAAVAPLVALLMGCQDRLRRLGLAIGTIEQYGYRMMRVQQGEEQDLHLAAVTSGKIYPSGVDGFALGRPDGRRLQHGEMVEICLAGGRIVGCIEQQSHSGEMRFVAEDGSVCGLCAEMWLEVLSIQAGALRD